MGAGTRRSAHRLTGASLAAGAVAVADLASRLEQQAEAVPLTPAPCTSS